MNTEAISIFSQDSKEHKRLEAAALLINAETKKLCKVNTVYFDYGQEWSWTTISIESGMKSFPMIQALNPVQQKKIVYGTLEEFTDTVKELINKYI